MKTTFAKNLSIVMQHLGFDKMYEFADKHKINRTKLGYLLRGERNVRTEVIYTIKRAYPGLNLNWLLFDQGEMILPGYNERFNIVKKRVAHPVANMYSKAK